MNDRNLSLNVENLFGFVNKTHNFVVGRENIKRLQNKLKFILITEDISENSLKKVKLSFDNIPIIQHYTSEDLEKYFHVQQTKIIGFKKSGLSDSIFIALKDWRLNG